jgi:hypothetical protein
MAGRLFVAVLLCIVASLKLGFAYGSPDTLARDEVVGTVLQSTVLLPVVSVPGIPTARHGKHYGVLTAVSYTIRHRGTFTISARTNEPLSIGSHVTVGYPTGNVANGHLVATSAPTPGQVNFNVGMFGLAGVSGL